MSLSPPPREPDAAAIAAFLDALFRYADDGSFVSLRVFDQFDRRQPPVEIRGVHLNGKGLAGIAESAIAVARISANTRTASVFAPPVATFVGPYRATEDDIANGVAISVDLDEGDVAASRKTLEGLLGPVTVAVASGGEIINAETGEIQNKTHLHWRLSEPTREPADHAKLKHARRLACEIVQSDPTAATNGHPLRWAGSWHMKGTPKLATIDTLNAEIEVHLVDAVDALEEAIEALGRTGAPVTAPTASGEPQAPLALIVSALAVIPNPPGDDHWDAWISMGLRIYRATGGAPDGLDVWKDWSRKSSKHDDGACDERWAHFTKSPPTKAGAGTIFYLAKRHGWDFPKGTRRPNNPPDAGTWSQPLDFLADPASEAPELRAEHIPEALFGFVMDTAERMGVDPVSVAMGCIVASASVLSDDWRIQPKRHDYTWTEQPRIWAAIVGDPSILKSPVVAACTKPIDKLDAAARRRHAEAMRQYKIRLKEFKADKTGKVPEPVHPKLDRYMVEGATVEAISEVLRDDDEALQRAVAGKVLSRHDEMSEFFGNLDRYKAGGKGGGDRGAYLRLYNGGPYTIDRIGRGAFSVPNWSACFLGGIQPGPIQKIAKDAAEDGLLQRFLYAVPGPQNPGADRAPHPAAQDRYSALFPALAALHPPRTADGASGRVVTFHDDAHQHREEIDTMQRAMALMPDTSGRLKAAFGKWPGLFARLALTFHLIDVADARASKVTVPLLIEVPEVTAARAAAFMLDIVLPHLLRADALMFSTEQTGHARWVARFILAQAFERITARDVVRAYRDLRAPEARNELAAVMASLVTIGWLEPEIPDSTMRSINAWSVNPSVHSLFKEKAEWETSRRRELRESIAADVEAYRRRREQKHGGPV